MPVRGSVRNAAFAAFGISALSGLYLASVTTWWLVLLGGLAILLHGVTRWPQALRLHRFWGVIRLHLLWSCCYRRKHIVQDEQITTLTVGASVPVGL